MKYCILAGSPREQGNTAALLRPFEEELALLGAACESRRLHGLDIKPCTACRTCQQDWTKFGCVYKDDMQELFDIVLESDVIVLATPIYSWYCTPPMKAMLDRLVYGMNKYYGEEKGPALWAGKRMAGIVTCGYRPETGADLFGAGMQRYCKHSQLRWMGMHCERDMGYKAVFMDKEKAARIRAYARSLHDGTK